MKRLLPYVLACLAALALASWLLTMRNASQDAVVSGSDPLVDVAALAIKGISLLQGERGVEFWRLKAEWAGMHQENGVIDVREPKVRYTLGEGDKEEYVHVVSDQGRITDEQKVLTLWGHVVLTRGLDTMTGQKLVYTTNDRTARFPDGADIENPSVSADFKDVRWNMGTNRVDADGVDITFKARDPQPGTDSSSTSGSERKEE